MKSISSDILLLDWASHQNGPALFNPELNANHGLPILLDSYQIERGIVGIDRENVPPFTFLRIKMTPCDFSFHLNLIVFLLCFFFPCYAYCYLTN